MIKTGTDYSGIGSPEEALKELQDEGFLEFESEFACDIDKFARASHDALHQTKKMYLDITIRNHSEVPQLGLYIAGFPCQSFSVAGKGKGFDDVRGTLFFNTADFIRINQPDCFILENVKGLLSHDSGRTFQTIIDLLSNGGGTVNGQMSMDFFEDGLGYHIHYKVLNTKEHGIPQNRERIFIIGFKESRNYSFPIPEPLKLKLKDLLEDEVDEKYYLSDKMLKGFVSGKSEFKERFKIKDINTHANCLDTKEGYRRTNNFIKEGFINQDTQASTVFSEEGLSNSLCSGTHGYTQGYVKVKSATKKGYEVATENDSINLSNLSNLSSETRRGRVGKEFAQTLDTSCNQAVIGAMRGRNPKNPKSRKTGLETKQMLEINENGTSNCLTSVQKDNLVVTDRIRRLTPLECWRLQGFSDESFYKAQKVNSDTQLYKQAGNSITKHVIKKVIYNIYIK